MDLISEATTIVFATFILILIFKRRKIPYKDITFNHLGYEYSYRGLHSRYVDILERYCIKRDIPYKVKPCNDYVDFGVSGNKTFFVQRGCVYLVTLGGVTQISKQTVRLDCNHTRFIRDAMTEFLSFDLHIYSAVNN